MTEKTAETGTVDSKSKNTNMAILAYILFFIPLLTDAKDDPFVKFHVYQGLTIFILAVAGAVVNIIPILGQIVSFAVSIAIVVFVIMGIISAAKGEEKELPIIGKLAKNFKF